MLEVIALLVYLAQLIALARSRGRSAWWAAGGLVCWSLGAAAGWSCAPDDPVLASLIGVPLAVLGAAIWYRHVYQLDTLLPATAFGRGDNFPCPCCASLQTEDRGGHLACHACGAAFGR